MSRAHGSGINTACYPSPASVHRSLSSDKERLKLCPRVQTPAPVLGRLHAIVPGTPAVLVVHHPGAEIVLQPPSPRPAQPLWIPADSTKAGGGRQPTPRPWLPWRACAHRGRPWQTGPWRPSQAPCVRAPPLAPSRPQLPRPGTPTPGTRPSTPGSRGEPEHHQRRRKSPQPCPHPPGRWHCRPQRWR